MTEVVPQTNLKVEKHCPHLKEQKITPPGLKQKITFSSSYFISFSQLIAVKKKLDFAPKDLFITDVTPFLIPPCLSIVMIVMLNTKALLLQIPL